MVVGRKGKIKFKEYKSLKMTLTFLSMNYQDHMKQSSKNFQVYSESMGTSSEKLKRSDF